MPSLLINNQTTVTTVPGQNLTVRVQNVPVLGVITVTGPQGPQGIPGPAGTGSGGTGDFVTSVQLSGVSGSLQDQLNTLSGFIGYSDSGVSGVLTSLIAQTGQQAWVSANGAANTISGQLTQTGAALIARDLVTSGALTTGIAATGQAAWLSANGAAGTLSGLLTTTGQTLYVLITGESGAFNSSLAATGNAAVAHANSIGLTLSGNLTQTGIQLIARDALVSGWLATGLSSLSGFTIGASGGLETRLTASGNAAIIHANGIGSGLSGALQSTGSNLYVTLTGMSGQGVIDYATKTNLTLTGQNLRALTLGGDTNLSGILTTTGQTLYQMTTGLSGQANTNYATITNLALTGSNLYITLTGLSGQAVIDYATKTNLTTTGQTLLGFIIGGDTNLSGNLTLTGQTLQGRINSLSGFVGGVSGALQAQIAGSNGTAVKVSGSATLTTADFTGLGGTIVFWSGGQVFVSGASPGAGGVSSLNGLASAVVIVGTGGLTVSVASQNILISGDQSISGALTQTGVTLGAKIDSLSGWSASTANLALTGSNLYITLTGMSGQAVTDYATKASLTTTGQTLYQLITGASGQANTNYATVTNLALTGSNLYVTMTGMSGQANLNFATLTNLTLTGQTLRALTLGGDTNLSGQLTTTGQTLYQMLTGTSGQAVIDYATKTNLALTGSNLYVTLTGLSGQAVIDYATKANLALTGSNLYVTLTGMSGQGVIDYATKTSLTTTGQTLLNMLVGGDTNLSGNLTITGQTLLAKINSLSGFTIGVSGALQALIAGGGSVVKVTGSAAIATADFTGIGGTLVFTSGGQVFVSGAAPGAGGGVPSVNGITSAVTITATGGFQVQTVGSTITISGLPYAAEKQVLFANKNTITGDPDLTWDALSGTLSINMPIQLYPDNPLNIGGSGLYIQSNIQNRSSKNDASADWVATTNVGNDLSGFVNFGINSSNYAQTPYDITTSGDAYLYSMAANANGGNMVVGTASPGSTVRFHTAGTRFFNLRAVISDSGIQMPSTGVISFDSGLSITPYFIASNSGQLNFTGMANNPIAAMFASGWGNSLYGPALHSRRIKIIAPQLTTTQQIWGDTLANLGTLSTPVTESYGEVTQYTPAAGLSAGTSFTTASVYRGSQAGAGNGFFFVTKFLLNSAFGSGLAVGNYAAPSGSRIFVGLTDQALATQVGLNEPIGNHIGLTYLYASGGSVGTGQYMQNWAIRSRDNVATSTGTLAMNFQTGYYRFAMYCPPFPGNSAVFYQLDDILRGSGVKGQFTTNLPVGSTPMRAMTAIGFVSGLKPIGTSIVYTETPQGVLG